MIRIDIETMERVTPQMVREEIASEDVLKDDVEGLFQYIRDKVELFSNEMPYLGQLIIEGKHFVSNEGLVSDYGAIVKVNYNDYYVTFLMYFDKIEIEIQNLESLIHNI